MTSPVSQEPVAHLDKTGRIHRLVEHLTSVGDLAAGFGAKFGSEGWARIAGRWHDLGKYSADFQNRIRSENGFEAHLEGPNHPDRDHSSAGAIHAQELFGPYGLPLAFAIAGHHAGLADQPQLMERLVKKKERLLDAKKQRPPVDLLSAAQPAIPAFLSRTSDIRRVEFWTRILFSALCDADFLDTEAFFDSTQTALRRPSISLEELRARLDAHLLEKQRAAPSSEVNRVRAEVLAACLRSADETTGFFSLTVPTGGGKTLASLAFALAHAIRNGLGRVIVAVPFTAILEQSVNAFEEAFGSREAIIEHHSSLDPDRETPRNRIASENWDAPLIVTTTVQLLESLFSNRPSSCRKLHNVARSVIILDEAQTLPPGLLLPILDGLKTLVADYGATVVFATATQPAFHRSKALLDGIEDISEIVPTELKCYERLRRVNVRWPKPNQIASFEELAEEIAREPDVLAIVHLRGDARRLCELVDGCLQDSKTVHLSALMCPEHRSEILGLAKAKKRQNTPVRLVSTQLVEAGVDVDFPVVYRALGGLDSLAQAAGRCNREGRLDRGELRVYQSPSQPPLGVPRTALAITQGMLAEKGDLDLFDPSHYTQYFYRLYGARGHQALDAHDIQTLRQNRKFRAVAKAFQLIENGWAAPIVVSYGRSRSLLRDLEQSGPSRNRLRALQRFTVTVPLRLRERWLATGVARWVADSVVTLQPPFESAYDSRFGLVPERVGTADINSLIVDG